MTSWATGLRLPRQALTLRPITSQMDWLWPYEGIYLGIGNVFNPVQVPAVSGAAIGQVNMVLGWSADGQRWKWLVPNDSIIPFGSAGDFDACGVFGAKQDPGRTIVNDTMRLYYAGCNGPFFGSRGCAL